MMRISNLLRPMLVGLGVLAVCVSARSAEQGWTITSPNGLVAMTILLNNSGQVGYQVDYDAGVAPAVQVILPSPMGLVLRGHDFTRGLKLVEAGPVQNISEHYELLHGKRKLCVNSGQGLTLKLKNVEGISLEIESRAYNDGIAFRYVLPDGLSGRQTVEAEETGFALPPEALLWCAPSDKAGTYSPAYETFYHTEMKLGTPAENGVGWSFPMLFRTADGKAWGLITEAGLDASYCGGRLSNTAHNGVYRLTLPNPLEGNGVSSEKPSSVLPWATPWRVVVVGTLRTIVESTLVTDVSPASKVADTS